MPRSSSRVLLTSAFVLSALVMTALPAQAQQTASLFDTAMERAKTTDGAFLTAGVAQGQQSGGGGANQQGFGFGIKGGFLFPSFSNATDAFEDNQSGTAIGIFFGGNRTGAVGVMGEILYVKKSFGSDTFKTDIYYLEIPILLRINIGNSSVNGLNVYAIAGPVFDIQLKAKQRDFDVKDNYETLDIGVIAGGGIEFLRFIAEARYNWGLRNVPAGNLAQTTEIKGRTFYVLFGFRIN